MRGASTVLSCVVLAVVVSGCRAKEEKPDVPRLLAELRSSDPQVSGQARLKLLQLGEPAVPALAEMLRSGTPSERVAAANTLWGTCPQCGSRRIRQYGTGTQRVEAEVQTLFPEARTLRWDYETTRKKGAHEAILSHFVSHRADVLVGTQMLAKVLDLPLVTLVGVVLADVGLSLPDYRTNERAFQVLTQVAGRAGRSPLGGQVIMQTFQPEHYVIQAAAGHAYQAFSELEITYRRQLGYPPFSQLVRLEFRHYALGLSSLKSPLRARCLLMSVQRWHFEK